MVLKTPMMHLCLEYNLDSTNNNMENAMLDTDELIQRQYVIRQSNIDDAKILVENYKLLYRTADNDDEQRQFDYLKTKAKMRVTDLLEVTAE